MGLKLDFYESLKAITDECLSRKDFIWTTYSVSPGLGKEIIIIIILLTGNFQIISI